MFHPSDLSFEDRIYTEASAGPEFVCVAAYGPEKRRRASVVVPTGWSGLVTTFVNVVENADRCIEPNTTLCNALDPIRGTLTKHRLCIVEYS